MSIRTVRPLAPVRALSRPASPRGQGPGRGLLLPLAPRGHIIARDGLPACADLRRDLPVPYMAPPAESTIFYDDVVRVAELQQYGFSRNLFVPINEHMQPFFQAVPAWPGRRPAAAW